MSTGILVIYADDELFAFMTSEGHALAAWITFSAYRDGDVTIAQAQALERTSDPFIELTYLLGANRQNDRFWERTLSNLATSLGVAEPVVATERLCVDSRRQWRHARQHPSHGRGGDDDRDAASTRPLVAATERPTGVTGPGSRSRGLDAVVVGSGPNGLAAAIELARAGRSVHVIEAADTLGGGDRTSELTLPGFRHDLCSTVVPLAAGSPFFRSVDLARHGVEWVHPPVALAHLLRPDRAVLLHHSLEATVMGLGRDGPAWAGLLGPLAREWDRLADHVLGPPVRFPRHPLLLARFGLPSLAPATMLPRLVFREAPARALFTGIAAHSMVALSAPLTSAFGIVLATLAHRFDWPLVRGGIGRLAEALVAEATELGVTFETGHTVRSLDELPRPGPSSSTSHRARSSPSPPTVCRAATVAPWSAIATGRGSSRSTGRSTARSRGETRPRPGPARSTFPARLRAVAAAEDAVARGRHPERPFILFVQPTRRRSDARTRRQARGVGVLPRAQRLDGRHDRRDRGQVERFAPGFRDLILARAAHGAGGDGGARRELRRRRHQRRAPGPVAAAVPRRSSRWDPYATPVEGPFLCSSSTPPGGGVHGMSGRHAARSVLRRIG